MKTQQSRIVVIGGGTGSFVVLSGLRGCGHHVSALVSMADDGGSTGVLRDELGVLPPGDVRQCLVALSEASQELRELFGYRFEEGSLAGHSFGNLFLSAVEKQANNFGDAVRLAGEVLRIRGEVIPITLDNVRLAIDWPNGITTYGEGKIDLMDFDPKQGLPKLHLEPAAHINPVATRAIARADLIVVAPGDLYTSLGALLAVGGVGEALAAAKARVAYVCNLVVKPGQTVGFTVADHVAEIERLMGGPYIDTVVYNAQKPSAALLERYKQSGEMPVEVDTQRLAAAHYQTLGCSLIAADPPKPRHGDPLASHRSYIRHDSGALARVLLEFL